MRKPSPEHYILLATFGATVFAQLASMGDSWHHVTKPSFWAIVLGQLCIVLRSMYTDKPQHPEGE